MFQRALPVLLLLSCSAPVKGERLLELRTSPTTDVDTIKGLLTLTAVATTEAGGIGSGTVRFTSDVGHFSVEEVALDEFGKAETIFSCVAGTHPFCDTLSAADVTIQWDGPSGRTTASRRIPLRRPPPPELTYSGDGGSGTPCESQRDCQLGLSCFENTCVGSGALRISLSWTVVSDYDLHVITPGNKHIFYANRREEGGELDVDMCVTPTGCRATNVENIFWRGPPPAGTYKVYVQNFNGRGTGNFRIQVSGGAPLEFTGTLPATRGAESMQFTVPR